MSHVISCVFVEYDVILQITIYFPEAPEVAAATMKCQENS